MSRISFVLGSAVLAATIGTAGAAPMTVQFTFGTPGATTLNPVSGTPASGITVSAITAGTGADMSLVENPSGSYAAGVGYNATSPMISVGAGTTNVVNSLADAVTKSVYFTFTITPAAGKSFSLNSLSLLAGRSASSSVRQWGLYTSANSYASAVLSDSITNTRGEFTLDSDGGSLSAVSSLQNLTTPLVVRLYVNPGTGTGSANAGRKADFDTITLVGSAIPEPASMSILGLGAVALGARRRRR